MFTAGFLYIHRFLYPKMLSFAAIVCLAAAFAQVDAQWGNINQIRQPWSGDSANYIQNYGEIPRIVYRPNGVDGMQIYPVYANPPYGQVIQETPRVPAFNGKVPNIQQIISSSRDLQNILARYPGSTMKVDQGRNVQVTELEARAI